MRIQAKRLHTFEKGIHRYTDLDHREGEQLKDLMREAFNDEAIPLYCFYNYYHPTASKVPVDVDDGWRYAYASDISNARSTSFATFDHLRTIDPLTNPMHWLGRYAEMNPLQILTEYAAHDGSIPPSKLVKNELPDYVFDELDAYMYPNGDFFKDKEWFSNIKTIRKEHKEEKGKKAVAAIIKHTLNHFMSLTLFKKKRQPHLIITIAVEPTQLR